MHQLEEVIKKVIREMNMQPTAQAGSIGSSSETVTVKDYPLGEKSPHRLKTPTGKNINEVTLDAVLKGDITHQDVRITKETLEMQAQIADSCGRDLFAQNLRRAAELISIPDDRLLQMYNSLRPYQSTKQDLQNLAQELREKHQAYITASLVDEAIQVYEARGRLKKAL